MTTALIIGDIQRGITGAFPFARQVVPPLTSLLPRARAAGILVVFVRIAFRPNRADLPPGNALVASFFDAGDLFHEGAGGTEVDLPVEPQDVVVLKRRASAFAGTDLELVLRARAVDAIAVAGVATSAMVAATCYDAADRGYRITVLRDGCADADPAVHDFFMDKVFPGRGLDVESCAGWLRSTAVPFRRASPADVASVRELVRAARSRPDETRALARLTIRSTMQLTLEAPSLRGYAEVRRIIDEALGDGIGMSAATAYGKLPAVARAAWFVEMLGAHADGSMHLHSQQFSTGELDGPMLLARLAEATCAHLGASQDLQRRRRGTRAATPQRESGLAGPAQPAAADPSPPGRRVTSREQSRVISGER